MRQLYLGLATVTLFTMSLEAQSFMAKKENDCCKNECSCCQLYGEYCKMEPEYFQTYRCEMEPVQVQVQKVRYVKRYFQKECCRLVPEKYYVTQEIKEPQYYTECEVQYQPKWFVDTHCKMVPKKHLKPVCRPCGCECVEAKETGDTQYYQNQLENEQYYGYSE